MLLKDLKRSMEISIALESGNDVDRNKFIADLKDSFFPVADKDNCSKEALGYANNIANAIINNIPLKKESGEFTHSILSSAALSSAVGRNQESIVKNTINYLETIMKYLNDPGLRDRIKDDKVFANPQRVSNYVRFLLMAEFSDQVLSDCGNNPAVATALKNLKENPNFKYIKARIEVMTNPYFARFYDNGNIYSNPKRFDPNNLEKNRRGKAGKNGILKSGKVKMAFRDMHRNLSIMESGIDPYAEIADELDENNVDEPMERFSQKIQNELNQINQQFDKHNNNLPDPKILEDFFSANGISNLSQATFFNPDGSLIGNYDAFSRAVTTLDKPDFFVGTPGGPLIHLENTITPRLNSNIQFAEKAAGDPYENIFKSGTPEANGRLSNAHISYGSRQFAEMERLFNEYNALVSQPGFDQLRAAELAGQIEKASITYLSFKANQRHSDIDTVKGKNSREQRRIDTARHIRDLFDSKSKLSNNVRQFENVSFPDPATALKGVDPNNKEAFEAALNKYLYDTVSPHIAGQIEAFKNHSSAYYDPFDYIAIDGTALPAMIHSMLKAKGMNSADNEFYKTFAPQYACEIIGASLLAKKSVTIHNHNGSLEHIDRPVTLRRAPGNAKVIKNEDYKNFFQGKLKDVGLYKTVFYDTRMQNEAYKTVKEGIKFKKGVTGLANGTNDALLKDYIGPWLEENNHDLKYVKGKLGPGCHFSVQRTAIQSMSALAAISSGALTWEEAVTPGAKADVKARYGAEFMNKMEALKQITSENPKTYKDNGDYQKIIKDIIESALPAVRTGVEYFKTWAKNNNFSIAELNTPEGRDFYNRYYILFDAFQEMTRDKEYSAFGGADNDIPKEIDRLSDTLYGSAATIVTAEKAYRGISALFSGDMGSLSGTHIANIMCHVAGNIYYDQIRAKNPEGISKLNLSTCAEQFFAQASEIAVSYQDGPTTYKLFAEMALNGKLKDLISDVKMENGLASFSFNYDAFDKALEAKNAADEKSMTAKKEELAYRISQRGAEGRSVQKPEKVQDQSISNNKPEGFAPKA